MRSTMNGVYTSWEILSHIMIFQMVNSSHCVCVCVTWSNRSNILNIRVLFDSTLFFMIFVIVSFLFRSFFYVSNDVVFKRMKWNEIKFNFRFICFGFKKYQCFRHFQWLGNVSIARSFVRSLCFFILFEVCLSHQEICTQKCHIR